jgi:hypothetical protein
MCTALVYRQSGKVNYINHSWKFCFIRPTKDTALTGNDNLHLFWDEGDVYPALRVCAMERIGVVANMGQTPTHYSLFHGDKVFRLGATSSLKQEFRNGNSLISVDKSTKVTLDG